MHKQRAFSGLGQEPLIHLIWPKHFDPLFKFVLLTHAGPDISVNGVRPFERIGLGEPCDALSRLRTEALRSDGAEVQARQLTRFPEGSGYVVPVPDIGDRPAAKFFPRI